MGFVAAVFLVLSWSSSPKGSPGAASTTTSAPTVRTTVPPTTVARANVKVQVANATSTPGVATRVTQTLQTQGWNTLPPVNSTTQVASSMVYYASGKKVAGAQIAQELGLPVTAIAPLTAAVPVTGATGDDIVVLVGPNLAS